MFWPARIKQHTGGATDGHMVGQQAREIATTDGQKRGKQQGQPGRQTDLAPHRYEPLFADKKTWRWNVWLRPESGQPTNGRAGGGEEDEEDVYQVIWRACVHLSLL